MFVLESNMKSSLQAKVIEQKKKNPPNKHPENADVRPAARFPAPVQVVFEWNNIT